MAVLSSTRGSGIGLLEAFVKDKSFTEGASAARVQLLTRLSALDRREGGRRGPGPRCT